MTVWQTDRRTDTQTDRILIARPRLHSMQRGKNVTIQFRQLQLFFLQLIRMIISIDVKWYSFDYTFREEFKFLNGFLCRTLLHSIIMCIEAVASLTLVSLGAVNYDVTLFTSKSDGLFWSSSSEVITFCRHSHPISLRLSSVLMNSAAKKYLGVH